MKHPINPMDVVVFLKSVVPAVGSNRLNRFVSPLTGLPLTTGNALASTFLVSALKVGWEGEGIAVEETRQGVKELHNELCYLLLEGVIGEMGDVDNNDGADVSKDSPLAAIYRKNLHQLLSWPRALYDADNMIEFFPSR